MKGLDEILERLRNGDKNAVQRFLKENATYIYNFPKYRHRQNLVESGDFYSYTAAMLGDGRRLLTFDATKGSFDVWFATVLDNFLNTLVRKRLEEQSRLQLKYGDIEETAVSQVSEEDLFDFEREDGAVQDFFESLNDTERAIAVLFSLFHRDVAPEEIELLSRFAGVEPREVARRLQEFLTGELSDEYKRINDESKKIANLHSTVEVLSSKLTEERLRLQMATESKPPDERTVKELQSLVERLEVSLWKKRTKYHLLCQAQRRRKDLVLLRSQTISSFLQLPLGTVTSAITRLRQKFIAAARKRGSM